MKTKVFLALLFVFLSTTGSSCINDGFLISVNLPISTCFAINPGSNLSYSGSTTIKLADQIDDSYLENIKSVRYYDIRVSVKGTYAGSTSGTLFVTDLVHPLFTYSGLWTDFATPQSLLGSSPHIQVNQTGVTELLRLLTLFKTNSSVTVTLLGPGSLTGQSPVPAGLSICLDILTQIDSEVK